MSEWFERSWPSKLLAFGRTDCGNYANPNVSTLIHFLSVGVLIPTLLVDAGRALAFQRHEAVNLLARSFRTWSKRCQDHQAIITYSAHLYDQGLVAHYLNSWKMQLALRLKRVKQARIARRWFLQRLVWVQWREKLDGKRRDKKVEAYERGRLRVVLLSMSFTLSDSLFIGSFFF